MGVMCEIIIHNSKDIVHRPGEIVAGTVKYIINEVTEYKNIDISFNGKATVSWSDDIAKSADGAGASVIRIGEEEFFKKTVSGLDNKLNKRNIQKPGCYRIPFEFKLTANLPPSYCDNYCNIRYYLKIVFEKANLFAMKKIFEQDVFIYSFVDPILAPTNYIIHEELSNMFSKKKHSIDVKAEILTPVAVPSKDINLIFQVTNKRGADVKVIKLELIDDRTYKANSGHNLNVRKKIKTSTIEIVNIKSNCESKLIAAVKTLADMYTIQNSSVFCKNYYIRVTLITSFAYDNVCIVIPVVIGEKLKQDSEVRRLDTIQESPPSYWEAMANEKLKCK